MRNMTVRNEFMRHMSDLVSTAMEGSELLRVAFEQRMKEVREEFSELIWKFVGSQASVKETSNLVVPLFRDPRKICPRGFANVRKSNPYPSKGRKRARKSAPNSSPASKRKVNPTSPPMTQDFMQTNDDKQEKDNDGDSLLDDIEKFWPLSL